MSNNEKYIRWQGITLNQVTFAINLLLGLATATLGFSVALLKDKEFVPTGSIKCFFTAALFLQLISLFSGISAVISRTIDFRYTARIARATNEPNARLRVKRLGKATWFFFWLQIGSFAFGILSLIISVVSLYRDKLF